MKTKGCCTVVMCRLYGSCEWMAAIEDVLVGPKEEIPFVLGFPGSPSFLVLKSSRPVSGKIQFKTPESQSFPSQKTRHILQSIRTFWLSNCGRKHL